MRRTVRVHSWATEPGEGCLRPGDRIVTASGTLTPPVLYVHPFTNEEGFVTRVWAGEAVITYRDPKAVVEVERA